MDWRALNYLSDAFFFETPERVRRPPGHRYTLPGALDWSDWKQHRSPDWHAVGCGPELPAQGWKIHVSATLANAQRLLDAVADYAWHHRLTFKFVPDEAALVARNDKQAHRGMSGKFITLYPRDDDELHAGLLGLDQLVGGADGPYILSDLRWHRGPLYVRYGAFRSMTVEQDGEQVPAIADPDGNLVPDVRAASFTIPPWVRPPEFVAAALALLGDREAPAGFPYRVRDALHFSNGGGVYRADGTGAVTGPVVLKEARPHAGLTLDRRDAVERLRHEADVLRRLADDPAVVTSRDLVDLDGNLFLVLDEVDGISLSRAMTQHSPMVRAGSTLTDYLEYRDWALGIVEQLDAVVARLHRAGIVHGDLHPRNVMVTPDDRVVLFDFEMAHPADDTDQAQAGAPGFTPPADRTGTDADDWSLAAIALFLFLPLTQLLSLDPAKAPELIATAARTFALPGALVERLHRELASRATTFPVSRLADQADTLRRTWPLSRRDDVVSLQSALARSLRASADFSRADRCYPGDPAQFRENGYGLAHGAAGVIHAQVTSGLDVHPLALRWLTDAVDAEAATTAGCRLGLYDGLAGAGLVMRELGEHDVADRILARVLDRLRTPDGPTAPDLYGGLAGLGLYLLDESPRDLLDEAARIADRLDGRLATGTAFHATAWRSGQGLMWGPSGVALFATRLFAHTGDARHLRLARTALQADLDRCTTAIDGSLQLDEGWRLMPYLASGSGGVGLVAAQLVPHVDDPEPYLTALDGVRRALQSPFTIEPGLFHGRAGFVWLLAALDRLGQATLESNAALGAHTDALRLHALRHGIGIAFPGSGLLRASCDLATGSAGVLTALEAYADQTFSPARGRWPRALPLLLPPAPETVPGPGPVARREVNPDDELPPEPSEAPSDRVDH